VKNSTTYNIAWIVRKENSSTTPASEIWRQKCCKRYVKMLLLNQPCNDWRAKSYRQQQRQEKKSDSALKVRGFWVKGRRTTYDVKVFNPTHQGTWLKAFKAAMQDMNAKRRKNTPIKYSKWKGARLHPLYSTCKVVWQENARFFIDDFPIFWQRKERERFSSVVAWLRTKLLLLTEIASHLLERVKIEWNIKCMVNDAKVSRFD